MAKVILDRMNTEGLKKKIYKFVDGEVVATFNGLSGAAFNAGISDAYLSNYMNRKVKKPRGIPANTEYSYTSKLKP